MKPNRYRQWIATVKEVITKVNYIEIESGVKKEITNKECRFGYRNSIFKEDLKDLL